MRTSLTAAFYGILSDTLVSVILAPFVLGFLGIDQHSPHFAMWVLFSGFISVAIGGYVTASLSQSQKLLSICLFVVLEIVLNIFLGFFVPAPLWFRIIGPISDIPAAFLGSFLARF